MLSEQKVDADPLAQIVKRCQRESGFQGKSDSAQHELYQACSTDVYNLMVRMVGIQDAVDLSQQVFLQVFRKIEQFDGRSKFKTWLYRLAVNEALQFLRKKKRIQQELKHEPIDPKPSVVQTRDAQDMMESALDRLDPLLKTIFLLKEVEGMSYKEIADATNIPEGTVGSRLNRARRELKQILIELGWEE